MGWADFQIERLREGETVRFRPRGNSMTGRVEDGALVTVEPISPDTEISVGDVVLCRVHGSQYLHLVKAVQGETYLIGNNKGRLNGWIGRRAIFGRLTHVEP